MIPYGHCHCGCGEKTDIAPRTHGQNGWVRGEPKRFVRGHALYVDHSQDYVVDPETGCWEFLGKSNNGTGYKIMVFRGQKYYTHRWFWEQANGPIPEGLQLDHLCRNRGCCNPEHLEPVTKAENQRRGLAGDLRVACPHGHAYDERNTGRTKRGARYCRTCARERARAKAKAAA